MSRGMIDESGFRGERKRDGLKLKYLLRKADGNPVDPYGAYFVLKLNSEDAVHARASRVALMAYAYMVASEPRLLDLSVDLRAWVRRYDAQDAKAVLKAAQGEGQRGVGA